MSSSSFADKSIWRPDAFTALRVRGLRRTRINVHQTVIDPVDRLIVDVARANPLELVTSSLSIASGSSV
jgi:hypothetical protein